MTSHASDMSVNELVALSADNLLRAGYAALERKNDLSADNAVTENYGRVVGSTVPSSAKAQEPALNHFDPAADNMDAEPFEGAEGAD